MTLLESLNAIDDKIWYIALILIVLLGIYSTIRLRGVQFRSLKEMCRVTMKRSSKDGKLSPFQVFFMSMANRIGVGNITGPILAILVGGPGAIFWMWIFALIGMATSFLETTVGQLFKEKKSDGEYRGGPAFNVKKGLGMKRLAMFVAFVMMLMYAVGFISMEMSSMSEAVKSAIDFEHIDLIFAVLITLFAAFIIVRGVHTVANLSVKIVPAMALFWMVFCLICICISYSGIPEAIISIFKYAFTMPAAIGGGLGAILIVGMQRGVLSNEAGIGTITNISSMADTNHPAAQGYSQALGVLMDTVVSTLTALVVLSFADIGTLVGYDLDSMPLLEMIFTDSLGSVGPYLVAIFLFVFAFTSMLADLVISESNALFIKDDRKVKLAVNALVLLVLFISSLYSSDEMFAIVDILLAVCGIINAFVMFKLGGKAVELFHDYRAQKAEGIEDPVFTKDRMQDPTGVTEWESAVDIRKPSN